MTVPLNLVGSQVRLLRLAKAWSQQELATKLQLAGWDVSRESVAKLESQFRRVPDCELLFLAKVFAVGITELFPPKINLRNLDPALRLKVSTKHPRSARRPQGHSRHN